MKTLEKKLINEKYGNNKTKFWKRGGIAANRENGGVT